MKKDPSIILHLRDVTERSLEGLKIAIVGGTGGIGRALALQMAASGAQVLVIGQTFRDSSVSGISFMKADLSSMAEARRVGADLPVETLDMVVMTTGIMAGPKREVTKEGIERDLAISYLSRYVILEAIGERLGIQRTNPRYKARVFIMGFPGSGQSANVDDLNSDKSYGRMKAHMNTVAGNEAIVLDARARFQKIDVFGLNPGFVKTDIRGNLFGSKLLLRIIESFTGFMTIKPEVYAARMVPLLVSSEIQNRSGAMFNNKAEAIQPSEQLTDPAYRSSLLKASDILLSRVLRTKSGEQHGQ